MELYWYMRLNYPNATTWNYSGMGTIQDRIAQCLYRRSIPENTSSYDLLIVSDYEFSFYENYQGDVLVWSYRAVPVPTEPSWVS